MLLLRWGLIGAALPIGYATAALLNSVAALGGWRARRRREPEPNAAAAVAIAAAAAPPAANDVPDGRSST